MKPPRGNARNTSCHSLVVTCRSAGAQDPAAAAHPVRWIQAPLKLQGQGDSAPRHGTARAKGEAAGPDPDVRSLWIEKERKNYAIVILLDIPTTNEASTPPHLSRPTGRAPQEGLDRALPSAAEQPLPSSARVLATKRGDTRTQRQSCTPQQRTPWPRQR